MKKQQDGKSFFVILESYIIAIVGGFLFYVTHLPLPWVLGSMTTMLIWKTFTKRKVVSPSISYNLGIAFLGIYFGLSFTKETFITVTPYIIPFILFTFVIITLSVCNSIIISKYIKVDTVTSVLGSIPGGLSEMVAASESLKANSSMVVVFQTIRLLTVVFFVPFMVTHLFVTREITPITIASKGGAGEWWLYFIYIPGIVLGWVFKNKIPAALVIIPLLYTALFNISGVPLAVIPSWGVVCAQITVGMFLGAKMTIKDLKLGGKYSGIYFGFAILLIGICFGVGYVFSIFTPLSLSTAILSFAPGGLVEMVLTANSIGADPAVVSSLQFIRLLLIILIVPGFLKWFFTRKQRRSIRHSS